MSTMCVVFVFFLVLRSSFIAQGGTSFIFNQFSGGDSTLELFGNASVQSNAISLTDPSKNSVGRAFRRQSVRMKDRGSMDSTYSFSTTFVFSIVTPSASQTGPGLAFVMTPHKFPDKLIPDQYMGLISNMSTMGQAYTHLFAVEFDTRRNVEFNDINDNHVGVDLNSLVSSDCRLAGYWINNTDFRVLDLKNGHHIQAWIDYDHLANELNVTIVQVGSHRPQKPLICMKNLSLSNILEEETYVGFSAATGIIIEDKYLLAWSFSTDGSAPVLNTSHFPSFVRNHSKSPNSRLIVGVTTACVLFFLVLVAASFVWLKREKHTDVIEEWEMEYWPHRFKYKDLYIATNGFRDEGFLGSGGFGRVYRGILPINGLEIAVKCITKETNEGVKEFIAEISSLGRLQHRNLVQIRGYCKRATQLFIVYDYMPNGSLDKMIFGKPKTVLGWAQRHKIVRDVAAGLLYLHEEWEQRVVHRDIKSSNVLLDSELNGKLGDFGLARLYEHNEKSKTTRVVGTLGYIAPEFVHTGKATPATDVFSFGIFMLEVACGRKPIDPSFDAMQIVMVDWVRELYHSDSLMEAADPHLGCEYVTDEMERVLKLGLLCSNPQAEGRLGMRQVLQILEEESPMPGFDVPFYLDMTVPRNKLKSDSYYSHSTNASTSRSLEGR